MLRVFQSEPKFLAASSNLDLRPFFRQNQNSGQIASLNARRFSARTEIPGGISQYKCVAFVGQKQNSLQFLRSEPFGPVRTRGVFRPVRTRGVFRSEPKCLEVLTSLNARFLPVRTKIPGSISQFKCGGIFQFEREAFFGQNQNSWQLLPVKVRGVCRSVPKFLAIVYSLDARRLPVRTRIPGCIF